MLYQVPSPKLQFHDVGAPPVVVSLNRILRGKRSRRTVYRKTRDRCIINDNGCTRNSDIFTQIIGDKQLSGEGSSRQIDMHRVLESRVSGIKPGSVTKTPVP